MELFTNPLPGELSAEDQKRLGIGSWQISDETIQKIEAIQVAARHSAFNARFIFSD